MNWMCVYAQNGKRAIIFSGMKNRLGSVCVYSYSGEWPNRKRVEIRVTNRNLDFTNTQYINSYSQRTYTHMYNRRIKKTIPTKKNYTSKFRFNVWRINCDWIDFFFIFKVKNPTTVRAMLHFAFCLSKANS